MTEAPRLFLEQPDENSYLKRNMASIDLLFMNAFMTELLFINAFIVNLLFMNAFTVNFLLMNAFTTNLLFITSSTVNLLFMNVRGCIRKFPDWPLGTRTANGTALCH
jgi:hypothetical protein